MNFDWYGLVMLLLFVFERAGWAQITRIIAKICSKITIVFISCSHTAKIAFVIVIIFSEFDFAQWTWWT